MWLDSCFLRSQDEMSRLLRTGAVWMPIVEFGCNLNGRVTGSDAVDGPHRRHLGAKERCWLTASECVKWSPPRSSLCHACRLGDAPEHCAGSIPASVKPLHAAACRTQASMWALVSAVGLRLEQQDLSASFNFCPVSRLLTSFRPNFITFWALLQVLIEPRGWVDSS
jgi:hypothetical protein